MLDGRPGQLPRSGKIFKRLLTVTRVVKALVKEERRSAVHLKYPLSRHRIARRRLVVRYLYARARCKKFYCGNIIKVFGFSYECDHIAARTAAEAIKMRMLVIRKNGKGR